MWIFLEHCIHFSPRTFIGARRFFVGGTTEERMVPAHRLRCIDRCGDVRDAGDGTAHRGVAGGAAAVLPVQQAGDTGGRHRQRPVRGVYRVRRSASDSAP